MFQSLRPNNQIYILSKGDSPELQIGSVVSVGMPIPKYKIPPVYGQPQEMVVDICVNVNGQDVNYQKLPASVDIADFGTGGVVISDNREAMNAEVLSLKNKSVETVNSIDRHKSIIKACDEILAGLNPEYAERKQQQTEINDLKSQVSELMRMNRELMARLDSGTAV